MKAKRSVLVIVTAIFLMSNVSALAQEKADNSKAKYVLELIKSTTITSVYIVAKNYHRQYKGQWLDEISVNDDFIVFREGNRIHSWDISKAVFIEKYDEIIKVKLPDDIGL